MRKVTILTDWVRFLLPLMVMVVSGIYPRPHQVEKSLAQAVQARIFHHPATASSHLREAAELLPWRLDLWEQAGIFALEGGEYESAVQDLIRARSGSSLSVEGHVALGDAYAQLGETQKAVETWQNLIYQGYQSVDVYRRLVETFQNTGELDLANQALEQWVSLSPDDPQVYYHLGLNQSIFTPDLAVESLQQAKRLDPALTASVHTMVVNLRQANGNEDPAYRLVLTGRGLGAVGAWNLAGEAFRQATIVRPHYAEAWAFLGEAQQHMDTADAESALQDIRKALEIDPSSVIAQALHAVYWQRQGKPDQALPSLSEAARMEPENPTWQIELGNTLASLGKLYPALEHFQRAVEITPEDGYVWKAMASFSIQFHVDVGSVGIPAARRAILLMPRDPGCPDLLGQALLWQGDLLSAERFFQRGLEIDPKYAPAYLHLGVLFLQQGERDLANQMLTRAAELDPEGPTGVQALRQLELYLP